MRQLANGGEQLVQSGDIYRLSHIIRFCFQRSGDLAAALIATRLEQCRSNGNRPDPQAEELTDIVEICAAGIRDAQPAIKCLA